jgi:acyl-CoA hydrolase
MKLLRETSSVQLVSSSMTHLRSYAIWNVCFTSVMLQFLHKNAFVSAVKFLSNQCVTSYGIALLMQTIRECEQAV